MAAGLLAVARRYLHPRIVANLLDPAGRKDLAERQQPRFRRWASPAALAVNAASSSRTAVRSSPNKLRWSRPFFSDIKGFSGLGELLTATTLVKLLNTYFSEMTAAIHARNGIIDLPCAASARADLCGMRFLPARSAPDRGSQVRS
jgi:hypothetical protein